MTKETSPSLQIVSEKVSASKVGRFCKEDNHFYNKKHSAETKQLMSDSWTQDRRDTTRLAGLRKNISPLIIFTKDGVSYKMLFTGFCRAIGFNLENLRRQYDKCRSTGTAAMKGWNMVLTNETSQNMTYEELLSYSGFNGLVELET